MRSFFTLLFGVAFASVLLAQPANDDCTGLIDLGNLPACNDDIFTNVGATASNVGANNAPTCFNGGTTQRDVWFAFTTTDAITDISILLDGVTNGPNAQSIANPQIALYRGNCAVDNLSELACFSAEPGATNARLDFSNLNPNTQYFIRVNDYSATAGSNAGDFTLCVQEVIAEFNMGEVSGSTACRGTLYDSGGPDGNYSDGENLTFTICPDEPTACINLDLVSFDIEPILLAGLVGDQLSFYAGDDTSAPLIAALFGQDLGTGFRLQTDSECVTVELNSDFLVTFGGFELNWECSATPCENRSLDNPVQIGAIPFQENGLSTCESAATFSETPCPADLFINGPEYVFTYDSPGDECISVNLSGASEGTGVLILNGLPADENTSCIAQGSDGSINAASLRDAGTYYIIVSNAAGCTNFDIDIQEVDCSLLPSLIDALGNPLNGCFAEAEGLPTVFNFERGFQDLEVEEGVNGGCWINSGADPSYYWFTIQAQQAGKLGFIIESANEDMPSDLDFNVWGPFTQDQVINAQEEVIQFIRDNAPIRSSWSPTPGPTGLADVHPEFGSPVTDEYDCDGEPGADGDDFVRTIDAQAGEVYVTLINDWGGLISEDGVSIDWSPSDPSLLDPIPAELIVGDTAICVGESAQIEIDSPVEDINWLNDTNTLSCDDCPNPLATPTETTTYRAVVDAFCYNDTIDVTVQVFALDAGADIAICQGADYDQMNAGEDYENATYEWIVPNEVTLSCTDCPNPIITSDVQGSYELIVNLDAPNCPLSDTVTLTVNDFVAPDFDVAADTTICLGESVSIGDPDNLPHNPPALAYAWTFEDGTPTSFATEPNPTITPDTTTTYFLEVSNDQCPLPTVRSVTVEVILPPVIETIPDTAVCQEEPILLSRIQPEDDVVYEWTGPDTIEDPTDPNTLAFPTNDGAYILTATRGACVVMDTTNVDITPIDVEIQEEDTVLLCLGEELSLATSVTPATANVIWTPNDGSLSDSTGVSIVATPMKSTTYYATVQVGECVRTDSIFVQVDSLPANLSIMPSDTSICEGGLVILESPLYEPKDFMNIEFLWMPGAGQQTPDSLYNMVVQPTDTTEYMRITTSGACVDTAIAVVNVKPIPQLNIVPSDTLICPGESVDLVVEGPEGLEMPMWMPPGTLSCTECFDPTASPVTTTSYQFMAELNGCPGMASNTIRVYPDPQLELNTQTEICLGESIQLNFLAVPGIEYTWTSPDDPSFMSSDPLLEVTPTETTTYTVVAQAPNCDTRLEADITIVVVQPADVTVSPDQQICLGESVTLTAEGTAPDGVNETYAWRWGDGQSAFGPEVTIDGLTEDTQVELTYVFGNNCGAARRTVNIQVLDNVLVSNFIVEPAAYETEGVPSGELVTVTVETIPESPSGVSYSWTANGQPIGGNNPQVQHEPLDDPTAYEVTIVTPEGCSTTDAITLTVVPPQHEVPNVFTPNNDGRNDFFNVVALGMIEIVEFRVYNRWGKLLYDNEDPSNGWDGTDNGDPAPSDVYVYYIVIRYPDGQEFTEQGDVTLIR